MDAAANKGCAVKCREQRIRGPLLGSAAAHLLFLVLFLLAGASVDTRVAHVVPVTLVEGAQSAPSGAEESVAAPPGGAPPGKTTRPAASHAPRRLPSSAAPAEPPISLGAAASRSPAAIAGTAATFPAESAEPPSPGPATEQSAPSSMKPPSPSPVAATPYGGTVLVASLRAGGGTAPAAFPAGEGPRASGDGGGAESGGAAAGTAAPLGEVSGSERSVGGGYGAAAGRLRDAIQSRIVYPAEAVRRGLEGEVLLRIRIGTGGSPGEIRVAKSSGARILDEAARRGVIRAAPLPSAPGWVEVPVRFSLRPAGERP